MPLLSFCLSLSLSLPLLPCRVALIATPEIEVHTIKPSDEFIVLATDGLWVTMTNMEVVTFVHGQSQPPAAIAFLPSSFPPRPRPRPLLKEKQRGKGERKTGKSRCSPVFRRGNSQRFFRAADWMDGLQNSSPTRRRRSYGRHRTTCCVRRWRVRSQMRLRGNAPQIMTVSAFDTCSSSTLASEKSLLCNRPCCEAGLERTYDAFLHYRQH